MFVTSEHKAQIRLWLSGLSERIEWMQQLAFQDDAWENDITWRMAAERALQTSVEYMTDIGSLIIDALVMRDPGGYGDILKVLVEEGVLSTAWFSSFEGIFELRARFIRDCASIQKAEVRQAIKTYTPLFPEFVTSIQTYLQLS